MNINEIKLKISGKIDELNTLANDPEVLKAGASDEQTAKFDALEKEIDGLKKDLERAEKIESANKFKASLNIVKNLGDNENKQVEKFSISKAIAESMNGSLSGLEKEVHEEGCKSFQYNGHTPTGLALPEKFIFASNTTSSLPGYAQSKSEGLIGLGQDLLGTQLGISYKPNLVGSVKINATDKTGQKGVEGSGNTVTTGTNSYVTLAPQFFYFEDTFSKHLLSNNEGLVLSNIAEMAIGVERAIEKDIFDYIAANVTTGTTGGAATWAKVLAIEKAVRSGNVKFALGWSADGVLSATAKDAGSGLMIKNSDTINGKLALASSLIADSHVYAGDWAKAFIGYYSSAYEVLTDPYSDSRSGNIKFTVSRMAGTGVLKSKISSYKGGA